jgi:hypothetical protein
MAWRTLCFLNLVIAALGCSSTAAIPENAVAEGNTIVFEGLPHPGYEAELFESEKNSKSTVKLHGSYFYKAFQPAKDTETSELRETLSDPERFEPFSGEKKCGGFHADYAVAWKENGRLFKVLICFGCGEVKRFGPQGEVREDMKTNTSDLLKMVLKMYDRDRPAHQGWGP